MRIRELYLKAFGPFTEKKIPFPGKSECGLVVVYGRNEAGKSSALRAIRDLLYGIHVQSSDDFLHRHADLRVGARLEFADGEELAVMRRKGKKNTLRCYEDREGVAAERLLELTDRIPLSLFENFYGLDHHGLTEGSKALLEDEGELGRALYGAGLGAGNLRAVLESLESEAGALFSPRGKNPRINATMAEWKAIDSQIRSASLNPKDWQEQASRVAEAEAELAALGRSIEQTTRGLSRRVRIRHSLPVLARRRRWLDQVTALPEVRELSGDFEPRLARLRTDRRDAERARERAARSLEKHTARRDVLKPQPRLIEARERIEMRHRGVTGYREIHDQLPRRESELMRLDALIDEALTVVGGTTPDALGTAQRRAFRVPLERSGRIQELASELAGFETRLEAATDEIEEARVARERIENERAASGAIRDPERLRRALVRAERRGDIDERIVSAQREVDALARECGQAARRLGLAASGLDRLERTVTPDDAAIDAFAERFEAAEARVVRAEDDCRRLRTEQGDVAESLARLRAEGAVPSEAELVEHRSRRDSTLRELRRRWLGEGGEVDATGRRALADRVEQRVGEADVLADRLRVDADRVAQQSGLVARSARLLADLELAEDDRARGLEAVASVGVEWAALWERSGVELRRPDEMRSWRRGFEALLARLGQLRVAEAGLNAQREDRDASIADVAEALRDLAERPEPMPDRLTKRSRPVGGS
ncbi:MAG: hypothetical protein CL908_14515 [Deltaproteobacteria bacterium]|nr:hypothetical protein [Deltaproteobacteria bacterium]